MFCPVYFEIDYEKGFWSEVVLVNQVLGKRHPVMLLSRIYAKVAGSCCKAVQGELHACLTQLWALTHEWECSIVMGCDGMEQLGTQ
jgi:hypothetical protein